MVYEFIIEKSCAGQRLDIFLAGAVEGVTRSFIKNAADTGKILLNGAELKKAGYILRTGDLVRADITPRVMSAEPEEIPLKIIYQDDDFAVIDKPRGMVVHPARGSLSGTLVNALLYSMRGLSDINGDKIRPGIVHRLDKDTSGLILIAKNNSAHLSLSKQISEKSAKRFYIALLDGILKNDEGTIETFIGRSPKNRVQMAVTRDGKKAVTLYKVIKRFDKYTLVEFELKTGRTHQIRVHAKHIGHTVTGDKVYGGGKGLTNDGQLLHAYKLIVTSPSSSELMEFRAELPDCFKDALKKIDR